ncbi:MAG: transglutaminase-like domain-containing protein [Spirochaetes bacterium]|nr:transglutaminase-like domain-containing protein [Spirochaetota bacterium]
MKRILKLFFRKNEFFYFYFSFYSFLIIFFFYEILINDTLIYFSIPIFIFVYLLELIIKREILKFRKRNFKYFVYFIFFLIFFSILYILSFIFLINKIKLNDFRNVLFIRANYFIFFFCTIIILLFIIRYFLLFIKDYQIFFFITILFLSSLIFIIKGDIFKNILYSSILFLLYFLFYLLDWNYPFNIDFKKEKIESLKKISKLFLLLILIIFSTYFAYQKTFSIRLNKSSSLLKEENFKFNFKDSLDISTNYSFQNKLLFILKTNNFRLLKAKVYSRYSYEKGFYNDKRELLFPEKLNEYYWENLDYIIGKEFRIDDEITVFNINLIKDIVFGKNEPYKIIPVIAKDSIFTNIFKSKSFILSDNLNLEFSFNKLNKLDYERYTEIVINDNEIKNFIENEVKNNNITRKEDIIKYFYNLFKKNYTYSLSSKGEGIEIIKNFLLYEKKGYCSHFAYAYAMILRYFGIPCRVVGGFKFNKKNLLFDDYYKIFDFNAHAWVEIWTDKYGWIDVDPTSDILSQDEILPFSQDFRENEYKYLENVIKIIGNLKEVDKKYKEVEENNKKESKRFDFEKYQKELKKKIPYIFLSLILILIFIFFTKYFFLYLFLNNKRYSKILAKIIFKDLRKIIKKFIRKKVCNSENYNIITFEDIKNFLSDKNLLNIKHVGKNKYLIKSKEELIKFNKKFNIEILKENYYCLFYSRNKIYKLKFKSFFIFIKIFYYFYFQYLLF